MITNSTKKIIIILSVAIVIGFAAFYGLYTYIQKKIATVSDYQSQIQNKMSQEETNRSLQTFIDTAGPDIDRLGTRIIPTDGTVGFIEEVESLARERQLTITIDSVNELPASTNTSYALLSLSFKTQGTWIAQDHFLTELENMPYNLTITNVAFSAEIVAPSSSIVKTASSTSSLKSSAQSVWDGAYTITVLKQK